MNCSKCGNNLGENDVFCPKCGTPVQRSEEINANIKNEGMNYNYERPMNQQSNRPNYVQPNSYSEQYENSKSSGSAVKTCVIIVIIVAILAAVGFVVYSVVTALNKNNNTSISSGTSTQSSPTQSTPTQSTPTTSNNSGSVSQVANTQNSSTYKVNYAGFKLYIPENLIYEFDTTNNAINIGDTLSSWVVQLSIQNIPFQQLKQNKNYLSSYFTEALSSYNAKVSNATVETIDGVEFILMEVDLGGTHEIMAVSGLNSMYSACLEVANENNDYDRDVLKNIAPILKTAEYDGETKNLKTNEKIKTTDINKALQKATEGQTNK